MGLQSRAFPRTFLLAFQLLWSNADRYAKYLIFVVLILVLAGSAVSTLAPLTFKFIVDQVISNRDTDSQLILISLVLAYALAEWMGRTLNELRSLHHGRADRRLQKQLSSAVFKHIMALPLQFHVDRRTGALNQVLVNGIVGYRLVLHHTMVSVLPVVVEFAAIAFVLILFDHSVFLVIISFSVLLYALVFWNGAIRLVWTARSAAGADVDASAVLTDSILNYETVKYFGAEERATERFNAALAKTECEWFRLLRYRASNGLTIACLVGGTLGLSAYVAVLEVRQGTMTVGEFVLVNAYVLRITQPLELVALASRDICQGLAFIGRLVELFAEKVELAITHECSSLPTGPLDVAFEHVSYAYDPGRWVLRDVSFVVPSGKTVAVVGASGAGKSSLVRLALRMVTPCEGEIRLGGVALSNLSASEIRKAIAVVPQDVALFNDSIAYNIGLGTAEPSHEDIVLAARTASIHDFVAHLPNGYDTTVGERGVRLSGGEKQRLAIARAAIKRPRIYILDEATSSLDSRTEQAILHEFGKVAKEATTLIIAHRLSTVVNADEIVVLSEGTVSEQGTHRALLRRNGAYAEMWAAQNSATGENTEASSPSYG